jgi:hypothetical protein
MLYICCFYVANSILHYSSTQFMIKPNMPPLMPEVGFQDTPSTPQLRKSVRFLKAVRYGRMLSGIKRRLKPIVISIGKSALRRSWIKRSVLAVLNRSPMLKTRLYRIVWKDITLSPRAMRIYTMLSTVIPTHSKGFD